MVALVRADPAGIGRPRDRRHGDAKARADARRTFDPHGAVMGERDVFDDGKTDPGAAATPGRVLLIEAFKEPGEMLPGNADSGIFDPEGDAVIGIPCGADGNSTVARGELDRIVDQVDECSFEHPAIAAD